MAGAKRPCARRGRVGSRTSRCRVYGRIQRSCRPRILADRCTGTGRAVNSWPAHRHRSTRSAPWPRRSSRTGPDARSASRRRCHRARKTASLVRPRCGCSTSCCAVVAVQTDELSSLACLLLCALTPLVNDVTKSDQRAKSVQPPPIEKQQQSRKHQDDPIPEVQRMQAVTHGRH